jgi:hypothetical protein
MSYSIYHATQNRQQPVDVSISSKGSDKKNEYGFNKVFLPYQSYHPKIIKMRTIDNNEKSSQSFKSPRGSDGTEESKKQDQLR